MSKIKILNIMKNIEYYIKYRKISEIKNTEKYRKL